MTTLVITVIGEDRPGLVSALADVVAEHGGSWGHSQLSELAGTFAGILTVDVPGPAVEPLVQALGALQGVLETTVRRSDGDRPSAPVDGPSTHLDLVGHDRPGIVREITGVLAAAGVSVESLETQVRPAPQAGGDLFHARAVLRAGQGQDLDALRRALEELARELQVDLALGEEDRGADWE